MAHRSQCSSAGDNPLDPNYLPAHYREEYRLAIDALVEENLEGYYQFLQRADVVDFLSTQEIEYIQSFVQVPHEGDYAEQRYPVSGGDGSSDTYWPIHSDLDAPDLDLGWPQLNRFTGPTEVTTLVNPAEPDMPSIKEQARRLIKNAQQVVAIVMDMFTDVDIFAELLDAAVRNVAVYILLDEQNAHHFINMLSNCRVNLESIQSMRVRTVSGISYQCRSGKSLKGQMMDRFLLTDCRAVLSGNYSFMWSFEKLHRCLAHLFLGQLVSTFDEEFRILFAQSQPLKIENTHDLIEDFVPLPERQYLTDRAATFRDSRKYATIDTPCPEERGRFDERMGTNWKKMGLSRHESFHRPLDQGPVDMYKYPSQQFRTDESHDQSSSRILNMLERPAFKRHSYAEGIHGGQTSYQSLQQPRTPNFETPLRQFQRSHPPPPRTGAEAAGYSGYDSKFMSHAYPPVDQHPEPGLPQEIESNDSFDPVLNYLSSTSNVEMEQVVETFSPPEELPFGSSYSGRISVGPPFASETTPAPSEQTQFYQDRKDPAVKQGLRNWRINSYLSAFDNAGDDEMPLPPPHGADPFEESSNPLHHTVSGPDLSITKFSSARESKFPKAGQLLSYSRSAVPEPSEKNLDEFILMAAGAKITPTTSESSFTTETDKTDELEQKEPRPEESFRRRPKAAVQRSSRLRSSLIFGAQLEQPVSQDINTTVGQQDDAMDNNNSTQSKLPFASQLSSQWRSTAREPFKWSNYVKPATFDSSAQPSQAGDNKNKEETENLAGIKMEEHPEKGDVMATIMPTEVSSLRPSTSQGELSNIGRPLFAPESMLSNMSEADMRLMFFKELAAKRKAKQAAALASNDTDKVPQKTQSDSKSTTVKSEEPAQKKQPSCENEQSDVTTDSEKLELKKCQAHVSTSISDPPNSQPLKDSNLSHPAVKDCDQLPPATMETDESSAGTSPAASTESSSTDPGSAPSISAPLEGNTASPIPSESSAVATPVRLESSSSHSVPSVPSSSSEQMQPGASKNTTDYSTRPLIVRQPFKRSLNVRTVSLDSSIKKPSRADDVKKEEEAENSSENSDMMPTSKPKEAEQAIPPSPSHPSTSQGQLSMIGQPQLPSECLLSHPSVDISNASTLAAEQKTTQAAASESNDADKVSQKTRSETKSTTVTNEEPSLGKNEQSVTSLSIKGQTTLCNTAAEKIITKDLAKMTPTETPTVDDDGELQGKDLKQNNQPVTSAGFENTQSKVTTDSEKIEQRKSQAHVSISVLDPSNNQPLKDVSHPAVKDCGQPSPATMETAESSTVISPTESGTQSKNELESPTLYSLSKDSCSTDPSTATLPASNSAPLETKTHSSSTPESSVAVNLVRSASSSSHSVPPVPRSQSEIIELASSLSSTSDITEPDKSPSPSSLECSKTSGIPPEESAPSSLTQTVSCSDTATINPNSIGVPTEVHPTTLDSSETGSKSKKPNTFLSESPAETREEPCTPEPLCTTEPTSKTEHPQTDTNSVPLGSSSTAERSSHDDVKDETKTISIIHSRTCSDDPSEHSKTSIHNVPTELVDPPTPNAAENTAIEVISASKPDFDPSILALAQPTAQAEAPSSSDTRGSVSDSSIVVSKPEKITTSTPHIPSPSESTTPPKLTQSDLDNSPTPSSSEPTSKDNYNQTQDPTDPPLALESPVESESITHDGCPSEPSVAVDKSDVVDGEVSNEPEQPGAERQSKATEAEATNTVLTTVLQDSSTCHQKPSDQTRISEGSEKAPSNPLEAVPSSPQSKQPKVSQSRYHSSTANVLSSSNLRDDTKLLLGQISANSQNRNEPPKELAVTDDDKEGEAEKNASGQKDGGSKYLNRGATKPTQDREKLLQRIQTMRKERKVYSRFEIPP